MYTEKKNGQVIVKVAGSFNIRVAKIVEEEVGEALDTGEKSVVVDMAETTFIDSTGMGILIDIRIRLQAVGGSIQVLGLNGYCLEAFEQANLITDFCKAS